MYWKINMKKNMENEYKKGYGIFGNGIKIMNGLN